MTLTLQHEEVQQYFDMKDDLAHYKARCQELEETVENYRIHFNTPDPEPCEPAEHATGFSRPKDLSPANACKSWSQSEYDTIRFLFNRNGKYNNKPFSNIVSELFPGRSEAAVYTKLRTFGFSVRNYNIVFPIKLDYTKFPS